MPRIVSGRPSTPLIPGALPLEPVGTSVFQASGYEIGDRCVAREHTTPSSTHWRILRLRGTPIPCGSVIE